MPELESERKEVKSEEAGEKQSSKPRRDSIARRETEAAEQKAEVTAAFYCLYPSIHSRWWPNHNSFHFTVTFEPVGETRSGHDPSGQT